MTSNFWILFNNYSQYLEQIATNRQDKLDKHRFLVQSKSVTDEDYDQFISISPANQQRNTLVSIHHSLLFQLLTLFVVY